MESCGCLINPTDMQALNLMEKKTFSHGFNLFVTVEMKVTQVTMLCFCQVVPDRVQGVDAACSRSVTFL